MYKFMILAFSSLHCFASAIGIGKNQSIAVTGILDCNGQPASNVTVKLYEKESFLQLPLEETQTDSDGRFNLSGSRTQIFSKLSAKLVIFHRCNYEGDCYKRIKIDVPKDYISQGTTPQKTYDIGTLNLERKEKHAKTDCFNYSR